MNDKPKKGHCLYCKYFIAFDGVTELWTECDLYGSFEGSKIDCKDWKRKFSKSDLRRKIRALEEEKKRMENQIKLMVTRIYCQDKEIQKLLAEIKELKDNGN